MKKLFIYILFSAISLNLAAQNVQQPSQNNQTKDSAAEQTQEQKEEKSEDIYTKDFLNKFAQALYAEKENPQEAIKLYEELFTLAPKDTTLLQRLASLCSEIEDRTCSQKYIPLYLEEAPQDYQALALNAQLAWQNGNLKEAQQYYIQALKTDEQTPKVLMQYLSLLNTIDKDEAINFLKQLEQDNNLLFIPVNLEIAQIYLNQNKLDQAFLTLDNAIKKHPQTREFYIAKVTIYENLKRYNEMLKVYQTMEKEGLLAEQDLVKIGAYYVLQKKPKEAKEYYERAYNLNPSNPQACEYLSLWEQSQKNYLKAEEYVRQSSLFKNTPSLRLRQVQLLKLAGAQDEALQAMQQAYQDFNDSIEIGFYYALLLEDNNRYKQAANVLETLLQKQPNNEEILINYAYTLSSLKKYKKMQKVLENIISQNPKNASALNFLGYYLVDKTKQVEKGGSYIKQALEINPKDSPTKDSLAWYYYKTGNYQEALNILKTLPVKDMQDSEILWHFANVYEALGENQTALTYYQMLLNSEDFSSKAQKAIDKINRK